MVLNVIIYNISQNLTYYYPLSIQFLIDKQMCNNTFYINNPIMLHPWVEKIFLILGIWWLDDLFDFLLFPFIRPARNKIKEKVITWLKKR